MKIFLVFALVLLCGLAHGKSVADSSSKDENNNLEDQNCPNGCDDYQTITGTSKIKFGITIMIIGILLLILVSLGCPMANNYTMPKLQYVPDPENPEDCTPNTIQKV